MLIKIKMKNLENLKKSAEVSSMLKFPVNSRLQIIPSQESKITQFSHKSGFAEWGVQRDSESGIKGSTKIAPLERVLIGALGAPKLPYTASAICIMMTCPTNPKEAQKYSHDKKFSGKSHRKTKGTGDFLVGKCFQKLAKYAVISYMSARETSKA